MNFQNPTAFWIAIFGFALFIASLWRSRATKSRIGLVFALLRISIITSLALALVNPYTTKEKPLEAVTALLDVSSSITEEQGDTLLRDARDLAAELSLPLKIVPFSGNTAPISFRLSGQESFLSVRSSWQQLDAGVTNLANAISSRTVASNPFTLLLSDGYETSGSARNVAASVGHPIFPLISRGEDSETSLRISHLSAPRFAPAKRSVEIKATLTNQEKSSLSAKLEIRHGSALVLERLVEVAPNRDLAVVAQSDPNLEGLNSIQAKLTWSDQDGPHTVTKTTWLAGEKRDKVLLLSGSADDDRFLSQILLNHSYQLKSVIASTDATNTLEANDYKSIVLNNISANRIPASVMDKLRSYVRSGGGLVVIGGSTSFGLGGYIDTPLEEILPVKLAPPQPEKKRLTVAVQLVVDKSRSMATDNRLEFAKAAAAEVVRNLKDDDFIGVIGFDEVPFIALPVSRLSQVRDSAISRISRLFPTSRTNLFPALDEARRGLASIQAGRKHVIVLTDGKLPDPGPYYFELIKQMRFVGITVSTVMVGNEVDDGFLAQMAQSGGGAFYQTNDPSNLPKVFLSDVKVASGERTMREEQEMGVRPGPDPLVSVKIDSFPALRGFTLTNERDNAQTELLVRDSEGAHPLLASWNFGDGRVVAFTSDSSGRWSSNWIRWERGQEFFSDLVEASRRKDNINSTSNLEFDLRSWVEGGEVVIDLTIFADLGRRQLVAKVATPSGVVERVVFTQERAGHYRARLSKAQAGTYRAAVRIEASAEGSAKKADELPEVAWDIDGAEFGEKPHREPNTALLSEIAKLSGGAVEPNRDQLRDLARGERIKTFFVHEFLVLALSLFLLEVVVRVLGVVRRKE
jgi:uncharacterized membrane protein